MTRGSSNWYSLCIPVRPSNSTYLLILTHVDRHRSLRVWMCTMLNPWGRRPILTFPRSIQMHFFVLKEQQSIQKRGVWLCTLHTLLLIHYHTDFKSKPSRPVSWSKVTRMIAWNVEWLEKKVEGEAGPVGKLLAVVPVRNLQGGGLRASIWRNDFQLWIFGMCEHYSPFWVILHSLVLWLEPYVFTAHTLHPVLCTLHSLNFSCLLYFVASHSTINR